MPKAPAASVALASVAILGAALLAQVSCAGTGHRYDVCADAGDLCDRPDLDAGPILPTGFISEPAIVRHDGLHNGAPDVIDWSGAQIAVYRNATSWAADSSGKLLLSRSTDQGLHWSDLGELKLAGKDLREPKLNVFQGKLRLTATAWDPSDASKHRTNVMAWVSDNGGVDWSDAADSAMPAGYSAWRPKAVLDRLWVSSWRSDELFPGTTSTLLHFYTSGDGATYTEGSALPVGPGARQAEILVRANSELWVALPERAVGGDHDRTTLCKTPLAPTPVWSCWSVTAPFLDGPLLFEQKGILFLAARHEVGSSRRRTGLWQVLEQEQDLSPIANLPTSMADTGSPGLVRLDDNNLLMTFHTTSALDPKVAGLGHEPTAIEAQAQGFAVDVQAVKLDMRKAAAGR